MGRVATWVSATDHTFLAEEGEERLVLLRGEQQGAHVGDPPRGLLARAHGVAGGVERPGSSLLAAGEHSGPTVGDKGASRRQSQPQHPVAAPPAARGGRGKELTAGALGPRADREAPGTRPARLGPDGRCPRTPAAALNSLLLQSSGGGGGGGSRTIQHGSGGGRDHGTRDAGERAGNSARRDTPSVAACRGVSSSGPAPSGSGKGSSRWRSGCRLVAPANDHRARAQTQSEAGLAGLLHCRAGHPLVAAPTFAERPVRVARVC